MHCQSVETMRRPKRKSPGNSANGLDGSRPTSWISAILPAPAERRCISPYGCGCGVQLVPRFSIFNWCTKNKKESRRIDCALGEEDFTSNGRRLDASKDCTKHLEVIRYAWLRLSPMRNRFNEMIQDGHAPVADRLLKRDLLQGAAGTFDEYYRIKPVPHLFVLLASPEHPRLGADKFPLAFPRRPGLAAAQIPVP